MKLFERLNLQLFADGGGEGAAATGGGEAAAPGVEADPGQRRLLELGVPADKLRNRAKRTEAQLPAGAVQTAQQKEDAQKAQAQVAAAEPMEEPEAEPAKRMSWKEIMADPVYNAEMQKVVNARLRTAKKAEESMEALAPALEIFVKRYNLDPNNLDPKALAEKIRADDSLWADQAMAMGTTSEIARKVGMADLDTERGQRIQQQSIRDQMLQNHRTKLEQQAQALRQTFPGFDLETELQNPTFARMTGPGVGISVEDAYHAIHRKEIEAAAAQVTAQQVAKKVSNAIASGTRRPAENGSAGAVPSVTTFDYRNATPAQRDALKKQIREAAARGEKLYPGRR